MSIATIAIPTYNRAKFLKKAITSSLNQTFDKYEILIIDNNSTDNTAQVVNDFKDKRICYMKNNKNIGMIGNWNRCLKFAKGKYIVILGDDDTLEPNFLLDSVNIFNKYPKLGFTFSHCNKVDINNKVLMPWGYFHFKEGYIKGMDYIYETAKQGCCLTNSSTALLRMAIFKNIGNFVPEVTKNTFDFNMWLRISAKYDVYFINKFMTRYTIHSDQVSEFHWRGRIPTGCIGARLEIINILSKIIPMKDTNSKLVSGLIQFNLDELSKLLETIAPKL